MIRLHHYLFRLPRLHSMFQSQCKNCVVDFNRTFLCVYNSALKEKCFFSPFAVKMTSEMNQQSVLLFVCS